MTQGNLGGCHPLAGVRREGCDRPGYEAGFHPRLPRVCGTLSWTPLGWGVGDGSVGEGGGGQSAGQGLYTVGIVRGPPQRD